MKLKKGFENFQDLEQYKIERSDFTNIFNVLVTDYEDKVFPDYEGDAFKTWYNNEEFYILHKPSGTLVNWYKFGHVGRTNTCNKDLTLDEYRIFVQMLIDEINSEYHHLTEEYMYEKEEGED